MTTQLATTTTAGHFLFGPEGATSVADDLQGRSTANAAIGGLSTLSQVGREVVTDQLCAALDNLLDLDLGRVLAAGWRAHAALIAAGRRTAAQPGSTEVVELGQHEVTSTQQPTIDVLMDDRRLATLHFDLVLTFDVHAVVAVVRAGALVAVRPAHCDLVAVLGCEGTQLARTQARLALPGELGLGEGYQLVPTTSLG